jgi:Dolichyl-phosphate-mannose-protein mannosyltransferase
LAYPADAKSKDLSTSLSTWKSKERMQNTGPIAVHRSSSADKQQTGRAGVWSFVAAGLLAAIYLLIIIVIASHRRFWYDEVFTVTISRLPFATIWKALAHAAETQPPTYFMLVRIFERLPIRPEVATRLPSALSLIVGMLLAFDCSRRLTDDLHGLLTFAVLTCSILPYYGYEARPYALYFMFASLGLWIWLHSRSRLSPVWFGATIFLAVTVHYYAVFCLVPYTAWEIFNWKGERAPSRKLIAGCLGVLCGALLFSKQLLAIREFSGRFWGRAELSHLASIFNDFFPYGLFPLVAIMIWVALVAPREQGAPASAMQPSEQLGWFFGLIPMAGYIVALFVTKGFFNRYFISLLPGIAIAFSCLLWRQFRSTPRISIAVLLLFATLGLGIQLTLVRYPDLVRPPAPAGSEPDKVNAMLLLDEKIAKQYIVFPASDLVGVEARYYSKHPERFVFLVGPRVTDGNTLGLMNLGRYSPMHFWSFDDLTAHARETVLVHPSRYAVAALQRAGYQVSGRIEEGLEVVSVE